MIGKLKGIIDSCYRDHVIIDVGGVGYLVLLQQNSANLTPGSSVILLIETHVGRSYTLIWFL